MSEAPPGNGHYTDTHTHALDLLRDALGATVIATYPNARAPLPATGPCASWRPCHKRPVQSGNIQDRVGTAMPPLLSESAIGHRHPMRHPTVSGDTGHAAR
jgi:hypothetical protein